MLSRESMKFWCPEVARNANKTMMFTYVNEKFTYELVMNEAQK